MKTIKSDKTKRNSKKFKNFRKTMQAYYYEHDTKYFKTCFNSEALRNDFFETYLRRYKKDILTK